MRHEEAVTGGESEDVGGCCCFGSFWRRHQQLHLISGDNSDTSYLLTQHQLQHQHQSWLVKQLYKLKEVSEFTAGPRWKTLLRKMGAYFNKKKNKNGKDFRYNSQDYALNFDDGDFVNDDDPDIALGFSSRFAPPARS